MEPNLFLSTKSFSGSLQQLEVKRNQTTVKNPGVASPLRREQDCWFKNVGIKWLKHVFLVYKALLVACAIHLHLVPLRCVTRHISLDHVKPQAQIPQGAEAKRWRCCIFLNCKTNKGDVAKGFCFILQSPRKTANDEIWLQRLISF